MKITNVTVGKSVQVFQVGKESWNKISATADLQEGDTFEGTVNELFSLIDNSHNLHSQSCVDSQIAPAKKKMDIVVLKQYQQAIINQDEKTIADILKVYYYNADFK